MPKRVFVTKAEQVPQMIKHLQGQNAVGLDLETNGLDPIGGLLRLIQFSTGSYNRPDTTYIVDCFAVPVKSLQPIFSVGGPKMFMGHNLKFEIMWLMAHGIEMPRGTYGHNFLKYYCSMLANQILHAGTDLARLKFSSLASVSERTCGQVLDKQLQTSDWTVPELSDEQLAYAALDAEIMWSIYPIQMGEIQADAGLTRIMSLEMRALPAVAWMQVNGVKIDVERWTVLAGEAAKEILDLENQMNTLVGGSTQLDLFGGEKSSINWASPQQVARILQERNPELNILDSNEGTLAGITHIDELAVLLLKHRELSKLTNAYGLEFLKYVSPVDSRIHPDFLQLGAANSGRMSCSKPNMQQVPRDKRYRACFIPEPGNVFVVCDYSQIELRIAAEVAREGNMIQAYIKGEDLHTVSAQLMMGKTDAESRQIAKSANFALLYGAGAQRYKDYAKTVMGIDISLEEAGRIRKLWLKAYPGVAQWHHTTQQGLLETRTLGGRRRLNVEKFTEKKNSPVQGTGADGMKAALALIFERRSAAPSCRLVNAVHDEIVVECKEEDAEAVKKHVEQCMKDGMSYFVKMVPVVAEGKIAHTWAEK